MSDPADVVVDLVEAQVKALDHIADGGDAACALEQVQQAWTLARKRLEEQLAEPIRIDLDGALAGHHILLDPDELTFGLVEDLEAGKSGPILDALAACIVGGDLPRGIDRKGLRRLTMPQSGALIKGVGTAFQLSKS